VTRPSTSQSLPFVDEHSVEIAADSDTVWAALTSTLDHLGGSTYARLVGCEDSVRSGPRPFVEGSTVPGFRVAAANPGSELVLVGSHRFSSYAMAFRLRDAEGRTRLTAETRAAFPGVGGRLYRSLVIGTRAHERLVRRLLTGIRQRAERSGA